MGRQVGHLGDQGIARLNIALAFVMGLADEGEADFLWACTTKSNVMRHCPMATKPREKDSRRSPFRIRECSASESPAPESWLMRLGMILSQMATSRFLSGRLSEIVRVSKDSDDQIRYGLASYRWFNTPSFLFCDDREDPGVEDKA
jgi:hypothetical protein